MIDSSSEKLAFLRQASIYFEVGHGDEKQNVVCNMDLTGVEFACLSSIGYSFYMLHSDLQMLAAISKQIRQGTE